jgi:sensor histidine kinase YesM
MSIVETILHYQKRYRLSSHLLFWLAVLVISLTSSKYYDGSQFTYGFALIGAGLYLLPQIMAAYFLTYGVVPGFFYRKKYIASAIAFIFGSYLICALSRFLIIRIAEPLAGIAPKTSETNYEIMTDLPKLIYVYFFNIFSLAFVFLFIKLLIQHLDIQKRALTLEKEKTELEKEKTETELKLLKTQLHPHFLFNTLNNIYALSLTGSPATSPSIGRLAEILDHILYRCNSQLVPLASELRLLNNYIALERLRYDDRLQLRFNSHIEGDMNIPPLILLSLAENAFKHGASDDIGNPFIDIDLQTDSERLLYTVTNSFTPKLTPNTAGKVGLLNLKRQLELIYPGRHTLTIDQGQNIFKVILIIRGEITQYEIKTPVKKIKHEDKVPAGR